MMTSNTLGQQQNRLHRTYHRCTVSLLLLAVLSLLGGCSRMPPKPSMVAPVAQPMPTPSLPAAEASHVAGMVGQTSLVAASPKRAKTKSIAAMVRAERLAERRPEDEDDSQLGEAMLNAARQAIDDLPVANQLGEWRNIGPSNYGGKVYDVAVDAQDPDVVYAAYGSYGNGTGGAGGGLWRTRDGGRIWTPVIDRFQNVAFISVKAHPKIPGLVAAGLRANIYNQDRGVLLSYDGGDMWQLIGPSSDPTLSVFDLGFDLSDSNTLFAATHKGLFKTTNAGKDWTKVLDYSGTSYWEDAPSLALHPEDPDTLLLAVRSLGVMRSSDGGETWTRVDSSMDQREPITVLSWSQSNPNVVYAERISPERDARNRHIAMFTYKSTDAGRTWMAMTVVRGFHQGRYDMSISVDPSDENHVIIANTSMVESTDGLRSTHSVQRAPHSDQLKTVFAPSDPNIVYNGNDGGLWKSTDGGRSWARSDVGVQTNHAYSFAVDPDVGTIYLSSGDYSGIVFYPEYGWHNLECGFEFQQFYVNPNDSMDVYVAGKLQRVGNVNRPCRTIDPAPDEKRPYRVAMAFHPTDANTIYLGLEHLWKSSDRGARWQSIGINDEIARQHKYVTALQVAPSDPQVIYAFTNLNGKLWVTENGGTSWTDVGTFRSPKVLAVLPEDAGTAYVGTSNGLYLSTDGGATANQLTGFPNNVPVNKILIDPDETKRLFAATNNGVLISEDSGTSWARLGRELLPSLVVDLTLANRTLFATTDQGLWSIDLTGRAACEQPVTVLPPRVNLSSSGGTVRFEISIVSSCSWTATTDVDWAHFETYSQNTGHALIDLTVGRNPGATRQTTLMIADQQIPVVQFGGADPIAPDAIVTLSNAAGCFTAVGTDTLEQRPCDPAATNQRFRLLYSRERLYSVASVSTDRCFDTTRQRQAGIRLKQFQCHGQDHQLFQFEPQPDGSWQMLGNNNLLCQESRAGRLEQQPCNESNTQRFQIEAVMTNPGQYAPANISEP